MFGLNLWSSKPPFFNAANAGASGVRSGNLLFQGAQPMTSSPQTSLPSSTNRESDSPHSSPLESGGQLPNQQLSAALSALLPGGNASSSPANLLSLYSQLASSNSSSTPAAEALLRAITNQQQALQQQQQQQQQQSQQRPDMFAAALLQQANPSAALALLQAAQQSNADSAQQRNVKSPASSNQQNLQLLEATVRHHQLQQQQQQQQHHHQQQQQQQNGAAAAKLLLNSLEQQQQQHGSGGQGGWGSLMQAVLGSVATSPQGDDHMSPLSNRQRHQAGSLSTSSDQQQQLQQQHQAINLSTTRNSPPHAHSNVLRSLRPDSMSDSGSNHGAASDAGGGSSRKRSWKISVHDDILTCKVCGLRLAPNEIESHWAVERERLAKRPRVSEASFKSGDNSDPAGRPLATSTNKQQAGSSNGTRNNTEGDLSRNRYETYQKIQHNRENRLQRCVLSTSRAHHSSSTAALVGSDFLCPYCECKLNGLQTFFQHLPICDQFPLLRIVANSAKQSSSAAEAVAAGLAAKLPANFAQNAMPLLRNVFAGASVAPDNQERVWPGTSPSLSQQQRQQTSSRPASSSSDAVAKPEVASSLAHPNDGANSSSPLNEKLQSSPNEAGNEEIDGAETVMVEEDNQPASINNNEGTSPISNAEEPPVSPCSSPKNLIVY